jgi:hypothetical protein
LSAVYSKSSGRRANPPASLQHTVQALALEPDPLDPDKSALAVGGTAGNDFIAIFAGAAPQSRQTQVVVFRSAAPLFTATVDAAALSRLLAYGGPGNDILWVDDRVTLPALLDGGPGNDVLKGGSGPNILVGGAGNDLLLGSRGRNLLIGGLGHDFLLAGPGESILIGGATDHDSNTAALCAVMKEWARTDLDYPARAAHLVQGGGWSNSTVFDKATVHGDTQSDGLVGGLGLEL